MLRIISIVAACALCSGAAAQTIYKCNVDGKIAYGQHPCTAGQGTELAAPPTPALDPGHKRRLERDKARLARFEQQRRNEELDDQRQSERARRAALIHKKQCDKLRLHKKWADEDLAKATGRAAHPLILKARRQAEALAMECPD